MAKKIFREENETIDLFDSEIIQLLEEGSCKKFKCVAKKIEYVNFNSRTVTVDLVVQRKKDNKYFEAFYLEADFSGYETSFSQSEFEEVKKTSRKKFNLTPNDFSYIR